MGATASEMFNSFTVLNKTLLFLINYKLLAVY